MILTIEGTSVEELKTKLFELAKVFGGLDCHVNREPGQTHLPLVSETELAEKLDTAVKETASVKEKKTKKAADAPTVESPPAVTRETFVEAMKTLTATEGGMAKALKILSDLGVQRVSQVPEEKYSQVLDACKAG